MWLKMRKVRGSKGEREEGGKREMNHQRVKMKYFWYSNKKTPEDVSYRLMHQAVMKV